MKKFTLLATLLGLFAAAAIDNANATLHAPLIVAKSIATLAAR